MTNVEKKRSKRPHLWKSGPDLKDHEQYYAWLKHKSQAAFRNESHEMTFVQWQAIWNTDDNWSKRGNRSTSVVLTRYDKTLPWSEENCFIKNRKQHRADSATETQTGKTYKPRKNRQPKPPKPPKQPRTPKPKPEKYIHKIRIMFDK